MIVACFVYLHNAVLPLTKEKETFQGTRALLYQCPGMGPSSTLQFLPQHQPVRMGRGRILIVYTFSTRNCKQSIELFAPLVNTHNAFQNEKVAFMVLSKSRVDEIQEFLSTKVSKVRVPSTVSIASDCDGDAMDRLNKSQNVTAIPRAFIVNGRGFMEWHGHPLQVDQL